MNYGNLKLMVPKGNIWKIILMFAVTSFTWSLISPLGAPPDEYAHVQYSWAMIDGQFKDAYMRDYLVIPENLSSAGGKKCMALDPSQTVKCQTKISDKTNLVNEPNFNPGYPPLYYLVVGLPLLLGFSETIWHLMRFMSVFFNLILLFIGLYQIKNILNSRIFYGLLLALTPMVSYLSGAVNPSGTEIVAAISLAVLLIKLLTPDNEDNRYTNSYFASLLFVSLVLSFIRPTSWIITLSIFTVFSIYSKNFNVLTNPKRRMIQALILFSILLGYALDAYVNKTKPPSPVSVPSQSFLDVIQNHFVGFDNWIYKSIGEFGYLDYRGLEIISTIWSVLFFLTLYFSLRFVDIFKKISTLVLLFGAIAVTPIFAYKFIFLNGYGYQARYAMALICILPILASQNSKSNLFNIVAIQKLLIWLILFAFASDWIISIYRYAHGMPFVFFSKVDQNYFWWLSNSGNLMLVTFILLFLIVCRDIYNSESQELEIRDTPE